MTPTATTLGALRETDYRPRSVRDEIRHNVSEALRRGERLFEGIVGYDETVIPMLVNAILSRHDVLLLGLRGQAKTRLLRGLTAYLDEWVPVVKGSTLNEDPLHPLTTPVQDQIEREDADTPIGWLHRSQRFNEKLATPDVTMADLIGDIDPIRASRERLDLSDERVIHFGLVPRTHRGILCLNELPDLQARIQVGLLNILEERDIQIRGFPIRLPLDVLMLFTANPEDYTNRGSIITPLKDRIGSQIITHYPRSIDDAMTITTQEADVSREVDVHVASFLREAIEEVAIQARESEHVDQTSGVSARLSISALETLVSNVARRSLSTGEPDPVARICDLFACVPAITGKVELVYEGEQEGASIVAQKLVGKAARAVFRRYCPATHPDRRGGDATEPEPLYSEVLGWFSRGNELEINDERPTREAARQLADVDGLEKLARKYLPIDDERDLVPAMELVIEGMHQHSMLSKQGTTRVVAYGDMISRMMQDM